MVNFKLINSKEVQEKAFRLGYKWHSGFEGLQFLDRPFLRIHNNTISVIGYEMFLELYGEEITQKDFLALPEPIKVGDWVRCFDIGGIYIFQVIKIYPNGRFGAKDNREQIADCVKLTPEQIEVLGL